MTLSYSVQPMSARDAANYGAARARDLAFDAVHALWLRRQSEGMTQAELAKAIGKDEGWVSRTLNGPANWTIKTIATLVAGLDGELDIIVNALEDPMSMPSNYDAYSEYLEDDPLNSTATANTDFKRTWNTNTWQPDLVMQGAGDTGSVFVQIRRR